ncbi:hypothetical protein Clacol_004145 [Clathrus columnatus]|uniref:Cofilin n=1 Tax=Clathrus columnatus TaxID=1419009 RepID=A0AAV5ABR9_9AGAM|nr:hypothetical protein Clacol_004145 [Clathrus columnatus]
MEVFVYPILQTFGLYTPSDPTYGRYLLDFPVYEKKLAEDSEIRTKQRRIFVQNGNFLKGEDINLKKDEIESAKEKEWVYYRVWEKGPGNGCDVIALHGINDYGGKWALHISGLLSKGFRVIAPDMPSFGRSTGLHSYILNHKQLISTIESVILDVDTYSSPTRKIFLIGSSMGGGLILNFCALHPARTRITGAYVLCPMIAISPETRPHIVVETLAQIVKFVAGRLPILSVVRGNLSDDPRVEEEIQTKMRLSTAAAMLRCLLEFTPSVNASFDTPFVSVMAHTIVLQLIKVQWSLSKKQLASGISVNDECLKAFQELKKDRKHKYVIYTINDRKTEIIVSKTSSSDNYDEFVADLPEDDCRYAVYDFEYEVSGGGKRNKLSPDVSKIKSKMIYASSKDALRQALGVPTEVQATAFDEVSLEAVLDKVGRK